ncbi:MAG: PBP1A family penicillin-binding protein [Candidatus Margulisbacteria bacterium]|nr:PBP1A family penicillin-binding protein [Candidatus Margulisiibacteriota bacterium]
MVFERRVPLSVSKKPKTSTTKRKGGYRGHLNKRRNEKLISFLKSILLKGSIVIAALGFLLFLYILFLLKTLPDVRVIATFVPNQTTKIYSADGVILADLHKEENRITIPYSQISDTMKKAVVAMEDARFYKHHGVDPIGILRAMTVNLIKGGKVQGASTITQQLARNLFLTKKKKFSRKIAEVILAIRIERHYTKEEILHMYLNQVYWGHNSYGIESASLQYFGNNASQLTLAESAMLVGMLQAPELYSPYRNLPTTMKRKDIVLKRMLDVGLITRQQYLDSKKQEIIIAPRKRLKYKAPYFTQEIINTLVGMYGEEEAYNGGLKVYTPIIWEMQKEAEAAVQWAVSESVRQNLKFNQAAILALDPRTGYVVTMVGGHDFLNYHYNKTIQAKRQPGSSFKPFVYLTALSKKLSPGSILNDSPVVFNTFQGPYAPQNYDLTFDGKMPMRKALEKSINLVAIKLVDMVSPEAVVETAKKFGITAPLMPYISIALGSQEIVMMEMTSAYGAFATGGLLAKPIMIKKIEDRNGIQLYNAKPEVKRVYDQSLVYALVEMMKGVVNYGTGRNAKLPRPIAGKTGTTSDYKDAWFIGFVPQLVCSAWVGNDDNTPMNKVVGGYIPALMWKQFMTTALMNVPRLDFPYPGGMINVDVCWDDGKKYNNLAGRHSVEKFWAGYEPKEFSTLKPTEGNVPNQKETEAPAENLDNWLQEFIN